MPPDTAASAAEKTLKGKPRRNLQWIIGIMVTLVLVAAIFYGAGKNQRKTPGKSTTMPQPAAISAPTNSEINKMIADQVSAAEKRREAENAAKNPAPPVSGDQKIPNELRRMVERRDESIGASSALTGSAYRQRREAAAASPILVQMHRPIGYESTPQSRQSPSDVANAVLADGLRRRRAAGATANPGKMIRAWESAAGGSRAITANERNSKWMSSQSADNSTEHLIESATPYVINQGTIIPAITVSKIDSDLPGPIVARVSSDVDDTISGKWLLIPKGSRLIGRYDSDVRSGQKRVLVAFNRIIFPNGDSVDLDRMPGADSAGASGFSGAVDNHFWKIFGSSFLIAGVARLFENNGATVNVYGASGGAAASPAGQALVDTTRAILSKNTSIPPTLIIGQGYKFNVMVTKDLDLEPYGG